MFVNYVEMNQSNVKPLDEDGDASMGDTSQLGQGVPRSRGQKRGHSQGCQKNGHDFPCECQQPQNNDDVDLPLSKRICSLHIDHTSRTGASEERVAQMQSVGDLPANPLNGASDLLNSRNGFSANYPYDVNSVYYANNHLLYNLYLERTQRQQLLEDETRSSLSTPSPANLTSKHS